MFLQLTCRLVRMKIHLFNVLALSSNRGQSNVHSSCFTRQNSRLIKLHKAKNLIVSQKTSCPLALQCLSGSESCWTILYQRMSYSSEETTIHANSDVSISTTSTETELGNVPIDTKSIYPTKGAVDLVSLVAASTTLQKLVELGVDLQMAQKTQSLESLLQLDYSLDIEPFLQFFSTCLIPDDKVGQVLSKSPDILFRSVEELENTVQYMQSKKFKLKDIGRMLGRSPGILGMSTEELDSRLGYFQKEFRLTGIEVRSIMIRLPKLIVWDRDKLKFTRLQLKTMIGFTDLELREMILKAPKIFLTEKFKMESAVAYLCNEAHVTHQQISNYPSVLRTRMHILKERHRFLAALDLLQFDTTQPNYLSLKDIYGCRDSDFAANVAKRPLSEYLEFIKTL